MYYRPGTNNFLNFGGKAEHLKGICKSPKTRTNYKSKSTIKDEIYNPFTNNDSTILFRSFLQKIEKKLFPQSIFGKIENQLLGEEWGKM